jgi:hypothetical protein
VGRYHYNITKLHQHPHEAIYTLGFVAVVVRNKYKRSVFHIIQLNFNCEDSRKQQEKKATTALNRKKYEPSASSRGKTTQGAGATLPCFHRRDNIFYEILLQAVHN